MQRPPSHEFKYSIILSPAPNSLPIRLRSKVYTAHMMVNVVNKITEALAFINNEIARSSSLKSPETKVSKNEANNTLGSCTSQDICGLKDEVAGMRAEMKELRDLLQARKRDEVGRADIVNKNTADLEKIPDCKKKNQALRLNLSGNQRRQEELQRINEDLKSRVEVAERHNDDVENIISKLQDDLHTAVLEFKVRKDCAEDLPEAEDVEARQLVK